MKRFIALFMIASLLFVPVALAEETSGATYNSPNGRAGRVAEFLNEQDCIDHNHDYDKYDRDDPAGIGVDTIVFEQEKEDNPVEKVTIEQKYDFNNEEYSVFAVVTLNIFKLFKKDKDVE